VRTVMSDCWFAVHTLTIMAAHRLLFQKKTCLYSISTRCPHGTNLVTSGYKMRTDQVQTLNPRCDKSQFGLTKISLYNRIQSIVTNVSEVTPVTQLRTDKKLLLNLREVSEYANISLGMVRKLVRNGELECVRIGRTVRVPKLSVLRLCTPK